jgi:glycosyltransferase involved in cell wall biosynthesis
MNKITIAIATHNPVKEWLQQTIDSCKGVDAIIIGDDDSKDFRIEDYRFPVSDVRVMRNEQNLGCFKAFSRIIDEVKEGFVSPQADDDYFDEKNFPVIVKVLRNSKADVVHFPCQYFGKYNFAFGYCPYPTYESLYITNNIYGASFFRKELWDFLEGYQLEVAADWDFWVRALKSGAKFEFYRGIGAHFRVTERSMFEKQLKQYGRDQINAMVQVNADKWTKVFK